MNYAVIRINNSQYIVKKKDQIEVDYLKKGKPQLEVLLVAGQDQILLGKPVLEKASVKYQIINENIKGKKLQVSTFKAKSRYRRKIGFRPVYSKLLIEDIKV